MKIKTYLFVTLICLASILSFISIVDAIEVKYYYADTCPYCVAFKPFIEQKYNQYKNYNWSFYEISTPLEP